MGDALAGYVRFLEALDDDALSKTTASGWTVAATLAHLAFYDDWVAERWRRRVRDGVFQDLPDDITDLVNAAGARGWRTVDPPRARAAAIAAARAVTGVVGDLAQAVLDDAVGTGRPAMVDRTLHWGPHVEEITSAIG